MPVKFDNGGVPGDWSYDCSSEDWCPLRFAILRTPATPPMGHLLLAALLLVAVGCSRSPAKAPEALGALPEFELVDQNSVKFSASDLDGSIWVTDFIFTSCQSTCPRLTGLMRDLQGKLSTETDGVRFLSISVDPENDTPEALKAYAEKYGADQASWSFLTGDKPAVHGLVNGFRVAIQEPAHTGDGPHSQHEKPIDIIHSNHFVLLDKSRHIRGYYRTDRTGLRALEKDARALLAQR